MSKRFVYGLLLLAAVIPAAMRAEEWNKKYTVAAKPSLRVETGDGSVTVRAGGSGTIEARVTTVGWKIGSGEVIIADHQTGDHVELSVKLPSERTWGASGHRSVKVEITVPAETATEVRTGDGGIHIDGLKVSARLHTGDGGIHVDSFEGSLAAHTSDGSIHVRGRFDNLEMDTGDGSISGEILTGSRLASAWTIRTGDGSVRLQVPAGLAADLDVRTGDGSVHSDLNVLVSGSIGKYGLRGKLNGGGQPFTIRTGDGSVSLGKR